MALTLWKGHLKIIILNLHLMQGGLATVDSGKCMLTKTLSLLLLPALRHQLETGPYHPPSTPFPGRGQHRQNGFHHGLTPDGTDGQRPVLQTPQGGKKDKKNPPGDQGPDQGGDRKRQGEGSDGGEPDPPQETPQSPPTPGGEGEVEGHPPQDPNRGPVLAPGHEGILQGTALRLQMWEHRFDQLVESILKDLKGYWQTLKTPQ